MSSNSASQYFGSLQNLDCLKRATNRNSLLVLSNTERQFLYHATLATNVAAWDAYINSIVSEFYQKVSNPVDQKFQAMYLLSKKMAETNLSKFNTPNWENSRNLLINVTGFDPINFWVWQSRSWGTIQVQTRMNEVLKVRHSFAHGFSMPTFSWNQDARGNVRLTKEVVAEIEMLFKNLVKNTDKGLGSFMLANFGVTF